MATEAEKVAASQGRRQVPAEWQIEFQDWTGAALLSLHEDETVSKQMRAYALWELDYRLAFDLPEPKQPKYMPRGSALDEVIKRNPVEV